jgi:hypothetical protein
MMAAVNGYDLFLIHKHTFSVVCDSSGSVC